MIISNFLFFCFVLILVVFAGYERDDLWWLCGLHYCEPAWECVLFMVLFVVCLLWRFCSSLFVVLLFCNGLLISSRYGYLLAK